MTGTPYAPLNTYVGDAEAPPRAYVKWTAETGAKTLVAAGGGQKYLAVTSLLLSSDIDTTFTFASTTPTTLTHGFFVAAKTNLFITFEHEPLIWHQETSRGLTVTSSAVITGGCTITYRTA